MGASPANDCFPSYLKYSKEDLEVQSHKQRSSVCTSAAGLTVTASSGRGVGVISFWSVKWAVVPLGTLFIHDPNLDTMATSSCGSCSVELPLGHAVNFTISQNLDENLFALDSARDCEIDCSVEALSIIWTHSPHLGGRGGASTTPRGMDNDGASKTEPFLIAISLTTRCPDHAQNNILLFNATFPNSSAFMGGAAIQPQFVGVIPFWKPSLVVLAMTSSPHCSHQPNLLVSFEEKSLSVGQMECTTLCKNGPASVLDISDDESSEGGNGAGAAEEGGAAYLVLYEQELHEKFQVRPILTSVLPDGDPLIKMEVLKCVFSSNLIVGVTKRGSALFIEAHSLRLLKVLPPVSLTSPYVDFAFCSDSQELCLCSDDHLQFVDLEGPGGGLMDLSENDTVRLLGDLSYQNLLFLHSLAQGAPLAFSANCPPGTKFIPSSDSSKVWKFQGGAGAKGGRGEKGGISGFLSDNFSLLFEVNLYYPSLLQDLDVEVGFGEELSGEGSKGYEGSYFLEVKCLNIRKLSESETFAPIDVLALSTGKDKRSKKGTIATPQLRQIRTKTLSLRLTYRTHSSSGKRKPPPPLSTLKVWVSGRPFEGVREEQKRFALFGGGFSTSFHRRLLSVTLDKDVSPVVKEVGLSLLSSLLPPPHECTEIAEFLLQEDHIQRFLSTNFCGSSRHLAEIGSSFLFHVACLEARSRSASPVPMSVLMLRCIMAKHCASILPGVFKKSRSPCTVRVFLNLLLKTCRSIVWDWSLDASSLSYPPSSCSSPSTPREKVEEEQTIEQEVKEEESSPIAFPQPQEIARDVFGSCIAQIQALCDSLSKWSHPLAGVLRTYGMSPTILTPTSFDLSAPHRPPHPTLSCTFHSSSRGVRKEQEVGPNNLWSGKIQKGKLQQRINPSSKRQFMVLQNLVGTRWSVFDLGCESLLTCVDLPIHPNIEQINIDCWITSESKDLSRVVVAHDLSSHPLRITGTFRCRYVRFSVFGASETTSPFVSPENCASIDVSSALYGIQPYVNLEQGLEEAKTQLVKLFDSHREMVVKTHADYLSDRRRLEKSLRDGAGVPSQFSSERGKGVSVAGGKKENPIEGKMRFDHHLNQLYEKSCISQIRYANVCYALSKTGRLALDCHAQLKGKREEGEEVDLEMEAIAREVKEVETGEEGAGRDHEKSKCLLGILIQALAENESAIQSLFYVGTLEKKEQDSKKQFGEEQNIEAEQEELPPQSLLDLFEDPSSFFSLFNALTDQDNGAESLNQLGKLLSLFASIALPSEAKRWDSLSSSLVKKYSEKNVISSPLFSPSSVFSETQRFSFECVFAVLEQFVQSCAIRSRACVMGQLKKQCVALRELGGGGQGTTKRRRQARVVGWMLRLIDVTVGALEKDIKKGGSGRGSGLVRKVREQAEEEEILQEEIQAVERKSKQKNGSGEGMHPIQILCSTARLSLQGALPASVFSVAMKCLFSIIVLFQEEFSSHFLEDESTRVFLREVFSSSNPFARCEAMALLGRLCRYPWPDPRALLSLVHVLLEILSPQIEKKSLPEKMGEGDGKESENEKGEIRGSASVASLLEVLLVGISLCAESGSGDIIKEMSELVTKHRLLVHLVALFGDGRESKGTRVLSMEILTRLVPFSDQHPLLSLTPEECASDRPSLWLMLVSVLRSGLPGRHSLVHSRFLDFVSAFGCCKLRPASLSVLFFSLFSVMSTVPVPQISSKMLCLWIDVLSHLCDDVSHFTHVHAHWVLRLYAQVVKSLGYVDKEGSEEVLDVFRSQREEWEGLWQVLSQAVRKCLGDSEKLSVGRLFQDSGESLRVLLAHVAGEKRAPSASLGIMDSILRVLVLFFQKGIVPQRKRRSGQGKKKQKPPLFSRFKRLGAVRVEPLYEESDGAVGSDNNDSSGGEGSDAENSDSSSSSSPSTTEQVPPVHVLRSFLKLLFGALADSTSESNNDKAIFALMVAACDIWDDAGPSSQKDEFISLFSEFGGFSYLTCLLVPQLRILAPQGEDRDANAGLLSSLSLHRPPSLLASGGWVNISPQCSFLGTNLQHSASSVLTGGSGGTSGSLRVDFSALGCDVAFFQLSFPYAARVHRVVLTLSHTSQQPTFVAVDGGSCEEGPWTDLGDWLEGTGKATEIKVVVGGGRTGEDGEGGRAAPIARVLQVRLGVPRSHVTKKGHRLKKASLANSNVPSAATSGASSSLASSASAVSSTFASTNDSKHAHPPKGLACLSLKRSHAVPLALSSGGGDEKQGSVVVIRKIDLLVEREEEEEEIEVDSEEEAVEEEEGGVPVGLPLSSPHSPSVPFYACSLLSALSSISPHECVLHILHLCSPSDWLLLTERIYSLLLQMSSKLPPSSFPSESVPSTPSLFPAAKRGVLSLDLMSNQETVPFIPVVLSRNTQRPSPTTSASSTSAPSLSSSSPHFSTLEIQNGAASAFRSILLSVLEHSSELREKFIKKLLYLEVSPQEYEINISLYLSLRGNSSARFVLEELYGVLMGVYDNEEGEFLPNQAHHLLPTITFLLLRDHQHIQWESLTDLQKLPPPPPNKRTTDPKNDKCLLSAEVLAFIIGATTRVMQQRTNKRDAPPLHDLLVRHLAALSRRFADVLPAIILHHAPLLAPALSPSSPDSDLHSRSVFLRLIRSVTHAVQQGSPLPPTVCSIVFQQLYICLSKLEEWENNLSFVASAAHCLSRISVCEEIKEWLAEPLLPSDTTPILLASSSPSREGEGDNSGDSCVLTRIEALFRVCEEKLLSDSRGAQGKVVRRMVEFFGVCLTSFNKRIHALCLHLILSALKGCGSSTSVSHFVRLLVQEVFFNDDQISLCFHAMSRKPSDKIRPKPNKIANINTPLHDSNNNLVVPKPQRPRVAASPLREAGGKGDSDNRGNSFGGDFTNLHLVPQKTYSPPPTSSSSSSPSPSCSPNEIRTLPLADPSEEYSLRRMWFSGSFFVRAHSSPFPESAILARSERYQAMLNTAVSSVFQEFGREISWKRLWHRSPSPSPSFLSSQITSFRSSCFVSTPILLVIRDPSGNVFGGFASQGMSGKTEGDRRCFLFNLTNGSFFSPVGGEYMSIEWTNDSHAVAWGSRYDLYFSLDADKPSYSSLHSYACGEDPTAKLTPTFSFIPQEVEVFTIQEAHQTSSQRWKRSPVELQRDEDVYSLSMSATVSDVIRDFFGEGMNVSLYHPLLLSRRVSDQGSLALSAIPSGMTLQTLRARLQAQAKKRNIVLQDYLIDLLFVREDITSPVGAGQVEGGGTGPNPRWTVPSSFWGCVVGGEEPEESEDPEEEARDLLEVIEQWRTRRGVGEDKGKGREGDGEEEEEEKQGQGQGEEKQGERERVREKKEKEKGKSPAYVPSPLPASWANARPQVRWMFALKNGVYLLTCLAKERQKELFRQALKQEKEERRGGEGETKIPSSVAKMMNSVGKFTLFLNELCDYLHLPHFSLYFVNNAECVSVLFRALGFPLPSTVSPTSPSTSPLLPSESPTNTPQGLTSSFSFSVQPSSPLSPLTTLPSDLAHTSETDPKKEAQQELYYSKLLVENLRKMWKAEPVTYRAVLDSGVLGRVLFYLSRKCKIRPRNPQEETDCAYDAAYFRGVLENIVFPAELYWKGELGDLDDVGGRPGEEGGRGGEKEKAQYWEQGTGFGYGDTHAEWDEDAAFVKQMKVEKEVKLLLRLITVFITGYESARKARGTHLGEKEEKGASADGSGSDSSSAESTPERKTNSPIPRKPKPRQEIRDLSNGLYWIGFFFFFFY